MQKSFNVVWLGALAIILAVAGPWFDVAVSNHSFVKAYIGGIGIGILVLMVIWNKHKDYQITYHISYIKLFLGATFALGVLSIFWSNNPDFSITKLFIWITAFMAFYVAYNIDATTDNLEKIAFYLVIAASLIAIIGIIQYLSSTNPFSITQAANPSSTFGNKNMATQPISMIFPLSVFLILSKNTTVKKLWIVGICAALMVTFNFYTSTRASWIAISGEVFLMSSLLIIKRKSFNTFASWNKTKTIVALSSLALFFILINFNQDGFAPMWDKASANFDRLTNSIQDDKSLRFQIWAVARNMIQDAPYFGTGLGTWFHNLVQEGYGTHIVSYVQRVHNDLIEMAVEIGLVGIGVFFAAVIAILTAIWHIIAKTDTKYLLFYFALFEALSGSFVNMQFSFPYQLAYPALLFGLYIGFIAKKSEEFIKPIKEFKLNFKKPQAKLYKRIVLGLNTIIFIFISSIYISWIGMYSQLNKINVERNFNKLNLVETPIYHLEIQNIMNFLTAAYQSNNQTQIVEKVVAQMLKYWPNDPITNARYVQNLYKQKQYARALTAAITARQVAKPGSLFVEPTMFAIYFELKQFDKYVQLFNDIYKTPEQELAVNPKSYKILMGQALRLTSLIKYVPELYQKYSKYNSYNCGVEGNMIYYYYVTKNKKLKQVFDKEFNNPQNCLNRRVINLVKSRLKLN